MTDEPNNPTGDEEMVSKADLDTALARSDKLEKDLEDVRMEVLTPEYQKFLDAGDKPVEKKPEDEKPVIPEDKFESMTKKEIFDLAVKTAKDEINGTLSQKEADAKDANSAKNKRAVAAFASAHEDFETYRPTMYGLSLDPKHADKSLEQLYLTAKESIKAIHKVPTKEEQAASRRSTNERPGADASSLEKLSNMSNEEIANEAFAEVEEALDNIPIG